MAEEGASFHDQIVEQTGTKMEEEFWNETIANHKPFIPNEKTRGEQIEDERKAAEALKESQSKQVVEEPQSESIPQPEDNEHFKGERRIFQVTRMNMVGDPSKHAIRVVDLVHTVQGKDPRTMSPSFYPALVDGMNGTSLLKVEGPHGPMYYKTISPEETPQAESVFNRDQVALPSSKFENVYVELVPSLAMERGTYKALPIIETKPFKE